MICDAKTLLPMLRLHGRTRYQESRDALFFNWTCSGFTVRFRGTWLRGAFEAQSDRLPFPPDAPEDFPMIATVGEDGETLRGRFLLAGGRNGLELYAGPEGIHELRIVKLSENTRGKAALLELETDGCILPVPQEAERPGIEFIGDSITCGYGNEAPGRDSPFDTREENGWISFGAVCARELKADFSLISVSGISAGAARYPFIPGKNMEDVYEFTDVYCDERCGAEPEKWPFADRRDVVVLNLGTNDAARIWSCRELKKADEEAEQFSERYGALIRTVRRLRPSAFILCTLGPLDYFLFDRIEKAVRDYQGESGDGRIAAFKLIGVNLITEGYGAVGHPSAKTHQRMGKELAERIREICGELA